MSCRWLSPSIRTRASPSSPSSPRLPIIKKALNIAAGSKEPNKQKVGKLSKKQLGEIVARKMKDLNARDEKAAMKIIAGTARQMGVEVEM